MEENKGSAQSDKSPFRQRSVSELMKDKNFQKAIAKTIVCHVEKSDAKPIDPLITAAFWMFMAANAVAFIRMVVLPMVQGCV